MKLLRDKQTNKQTNKRLLGGRDDACGARVLCSAARDAFKSFDKKSEDKIRVGDIEAAMKRIGHNIKPDWLEKIEHMIDAEGLLDVSTFLIDVLFSF